MCMKKHIRKPSKSKPSKKHTKSKSDPVVDPDLDLIARELDTLSRQRLPDRRLQDKLTGYEAEIRQDAILLALSWYLKHETDEAHRVKYPWHPARSLAKALRIQKRDYRKALGNEQKRFCSLSVPDAIAPLHPVLKRPSDWSASTVEAMMREAIRIALRCGQITHANAAIALEVIVEGASVSEMADRLGTNRSNIYQHLSRVRRKTAEILDRMEVPLIGSL